MLRLALVSNSSYKFKQCVLIFVAKNVLGFIVDVAMLFVSFQIRDKSSPPPTQLFEEDLIHGFQVLVVDVLGFEDKVILNL